MVWTPSEVEGNINLPVVVDQAECQGPWASGFFPHSMLKRILQVRHRIR